MLPLADMRLTLTPFCVYHQQMERLYADVCDVNVDDVSIINSLIILKLYSPVLVARGEARSEL